jgi:Glycosyl hydrolases family 2, TIM barrel domain
MNPPHCTGVLSSPRRILRHAVVVSLLSCLAPIAAFAGGGTPSVVKVERDETGYHLTRDGRPYVIKGGGGRAYLESLKAAGGNSLRTWGEDDLEPLLDRAQELGLTVTVGIWLGQERQGFNYNDAASVRGEIEKARGFFRRYRRHPALLMWGLGNEMEGSGDNPIIWRTVNEIARVAKSEDPGHPTMTVIAEAGGRKIPQFLSLCPDVDVLGINSYGGLPTLPKRLADALRHHRIRPARALGGPEDGLGRTGRTDQHRESPSVPRRILRFDRRPARAVPRFLRLPLGP